MKVVFVGDVVGKPGRKLLTEFVPQFRASGVDIIIVNGENAAGGSGVTPKILDEILSLGVDVVTSGDHAFKNKEVLDIPVTEERFLRPANYSRLAHGIGYGVYKSKGVTFGVVNLIGRVFMNPSECPFLAADNIILTINEQTLIVFVDFHAEATSEKIALGFYLDGRATAVFGTHTHVQTADETIRENGTAYITDAGMTGSYRSVIGRNVDAVLTGFTTGMPCKFEVSKEDPRLAGVLVEFDPVTAKASSIKRLLLKTGEPFRNIV